MLCTRRLLWIVVLSFSQAGLSANETVSAEKYLESLRVQLSRPQVKDVRHLSRDKDFTKFDYVVLKTLLAPETLVRFEEQSKLFWNSTLLLALAGAVSENVNDDKQSKKQVDSLQNEDWLVRQSESNEANIFSMPEFNKLSDIDLVFLKQKGFARIESSKELIAQNQKESLGGIPIADFCSRAPGRKAPADFSVRFTPWDFASKLASSSRLDTSLLQLVISPDAFDFETETEDDFEQAAEEEHDHNHDENDEVTGWEAALKKLESFLKSPQPRLTDFVAKIRQNQNISKASRRLLIAAALNSENFKKDCTKLGGAWRELAVIENKHLELFSCKDTEGKLKGAKLEVDKSDIDRGEIKFSQKIDDVIAEAYIAQDHPWLAIRLLHKGKIIGSEGWFDSEGTERARRQVTLTNPNGNVLTKTGLVKWVDSIEAKSEFRGISFFENGTVQSFAHLNKEKKIIAFVGFYQSGKPRFWFPVKSGKFEGKAMWWHESGQVAGDMDFSADKRFGRGRVIYENGVEGFIAHYSNNLLHGPLTWIDPNQRMLFSLNFVDHKAHGVLEIKNGGRRMVEARFEAGSAEGPVVLRNHRGIDVGEIPYKGGLLNGKVVLRDANGNARLRSEWLDGQAHGLTESLYGNGARAAMCTFKEGHLLEWSSQSVDGVVRYRGDVTHYAEGQSKVSFFAGAKTPLLQCGTQDWAIEKCDLLDGAIRVPLPSHKELSAKIDVNSELKFKPEKCGGLLKNLDVSSLLDQDSGKVHLEFSMKEECPSLLYASRMHCELGVVSKKWTIESCVLFEERSDIEDNAEIEIDDSAI